MVDKNITKNYNEARKQKGELSLETKKVKIIMANTTRVLEKKVVSDEELKEVLRKPNGYEEKMKVYKQYWVSDKFIEENANWINWDLLCMYQPLKPKLVEKYHLDIDFDKLVSYQKVSQKILLKFREDIDVDNLVKYQPLTEKFIEKYHDLFEMCWSNIVFYQQLSLQFLIDHKNKFEIDDLEGGNIDGATIDNFKIFTKMGII
jgi:hypothetical protein